MPLMSDLTKEIRQYLSHHPELQPCVPQIVQTTRLLHETYASDRQVLLAGNGGSAADAEHWAGELLKGFYLERSLSTDDRKSLSPTLADKLQGGLRTIPLTSFPILRTAVLNDQGPDMDFAQLVWALGRPRDAFVGISTSGNSKNLLLAAEAAKARGMTVIALTGKEGGQLKKYADAWIGVPAARTHYIQEMHLAIYHAISLVLEKQFFDLSNAVSSWQ